MFDVFPPVLVYLLGAVLLPLLPNAALRAGLSLLVPVIGGWLIWTLPEGNHAVVSLAGLDLTLIRNDKLASVFALIFSLAAFLSLLYAWHVRDRVQQTATLLYAGSAIGAVFAGDLISLFLFWEGTAIASVFLIWARGTEGAYHTGLRYLLIQVTSGVILLAGAALYWRETGSLAFEHMTLGSAATWLIFLAIGIKCGFPLLNNWLADAYPVATVTGTVILSAFTTKLAIYALARGFAGTELLIWIGVGMVLITVVQAMIENDLRRVLAYSLNNQLGFMVVGIGIGTELALNGAASHAVASVLYKAVLLMAVGAVLFRTGTAKASDLGGLYRTMPLTALFALVGSASIAAMPLFSGFVTKSLILSAAQHEHHYIAWAVLLFGSAAAVMHTAIRIPYAAFFGPDSGLRPHEAPAHMLLAMGLTAAFCVAIGVYPKALYALLPYAVDYKSYTTYHVVQQLQLVAFAALVFAVMMRAGLYPKSERSIVLDTDWVYRRLLPRVVGALSATMGAVWALVASAQERWLRGIILRLYRTHGPASRIALNWPTGSMVQWVAIVLGITLIVTFLS
ncbi:Na(+)/H(+) antiporter subunit D [Seohaeicola zhoushanensis]|uniref:Na(+)/H(+) antiporter subunit D n=1 Tax=Seohaeicola zhoushanensis TaxID=1569283 RepID=A0A8J3H093_9RHOB|nr:Na(+)/H(+) antiporter subunit D [Seohaeicola zhoushanensis]GHF57972.1 Na(+)/H(+) antiporter subunit D [Seohaeicola zhoushanensis]